jgi:polar amino acid transport system substrate-binding protein
MMDDDDVFPKTGLIVLAIILLSVTALYSWGQYHSVKSTLERIQDGETIRIGFANEDPYGYLDLKTRRITGEAPEIARAILVRMGAKPSQIKTVVTRFGALIPGLRAKRFDIIAAGMYITPPRARYIAFTNPTYAIGEAFIVPQGNPKGLHSFEDVAADPDARLGVVIGAIEQQYAESLDVPDHRIIRFPDNAAGLAGLRTGRIDAFAATILTAQRLLEKADDPSLELAEPFRDPVIEGRNIRGYGAFGMRLDEPELVEAFNEHLADFLGSREHLELVEPFGFSERTLPGDVTAEELSRPAETNN